MVLRGEWMDADLNKFNADHRVTHHPRMSDREWDEAYLKAWDSYYSSDHIETVARRKAALPNGRVARVVAFMTIFRLLQGVERIHPLEGGVVRLKYRRDRRPGLPLELPVVFHLKMVADFARKLVRCARAGFLSWRIARRVLGDPARSTYSDTATTPVDESDIDRLEMFSATMGAEVAVARKRDEDQRRAKVAMRSAAE